MSYQDTLKEVYNKGLRDGKSAQRAKTNDTTPDWSQECDVCGSIPIVPVTGMCGPCTFGDADTIGGNRLDFTHHFASLYM